MSEKRTGWFPAAGTLVGTLESWRTVYSWNGEVYPTQGAAIKAGFQQFGSDDFNVGKVHADRLVWWGWMREQHPDEDRIEVAAALGLADGTTR